MVEPFLQLQGVTKVYKEQNVVANNSVDFSVMKNEIHAIVGENGAGKSTLMKVLYGLEHPDEGTIRLSGREVEIPNPMEANRLGIGMVHQHFRLVPDFTVAENIVLGIEPKKNIVLFDKGKALKEVRRVIEEHQFALDPVSRVRDLTVGQMQQVEILKMLYRKVDLLILDEPTSVLTEQEIQRLFTNLRALMKSGKTIIIITHKLDEVLAISHRITVMRKGSVVAVRDTEDVDRSELAKLMVGRTILFELEREKQEPGNNVLLLNKCILQAKGRERPLLDQVSLTVRSGEVVGIAGVGGNGLGELEDVLAGLRSLTSGRIVLEETDITEMSARQRRDRGVAYVPADRLKRGACMPSSVEENMIVVNHHDFIRGGFIDYAKVQNHTEELIQRFSIDGHNAMPIGTLSGGNIQKVILARELSSDVRFILFSEPTWGLDIASSQFVYEKILELRKNGAGILLISSNLDEVLGLCDRVLVMYRGKIVTNKENINLSKETIGEYMLGIKDDTL